MLGKRLIIETLLGDCPRPLPASTSIRPDPHPPPTPLGRAFRPPTWGELARELGQGKVDQDALKDREETLLRLLDACR